MASKGAEQILPADLLLEALVGCLDLYGYSFASVLGAKFLLAHLACVGEVHQRSCDQKRSRSASKIALMSQDALREFHCRRRLDGVAPTPAAHPAVKGRVPPAKRARGR